MSEKIRVAVVGGNFGEVHIQGFSHCPEIEVVAICRRQEKIAKQIAQKYGISSWFTSFDEMMRSVDIEVVSLAVPNHLHYPMTLKAFEQGKHVICEKPLALTAQEAEEMVREAEKKGKMHMTVFNWRFVPAIARMKELVEEGEVGSIFHVSFSWLSNRRREREEPYTWRFTQNEAGYGALGDTGVHGIDLIHWIVGDFRRVVSTMNIFVPEHKAGKVNYKKTEVEDCCSFLGDLATGSQAIFQVSSVASCDSMMRLEIHGGKGVLGVQLFPSAGDYTGKLFGGKGEKDLRREIPIPKRLISDIGPKQQNDSPPSLFFCKICAAADKGNADRS